MHRVESIDFEGPFLVLQVNGRILRVDLRTQSELLFQANDRVRRNYEVSPSGYGIHWPELDEDLSIDGLIRAAQNNRKLIRSK